MTLNYTGDTQRKHQELHSSTFSPGGSTVTLSSVVCLEITAFLAVCHFQLLSVISCEIYITNVN